VRVSQTNVCEKKSVVTTVVRVCWIFHSQNYSQNDILDSSLQGRVLRKSGIGQNLCWLAMLVFQPKTNILNCNSRPSREPGVPECSRTGLAALLLIGPA
jgi:hypothetical protein